MVEYIIYVHVRYNAKHIRSLQQFSNSHNDEIEIMQIDLIRDNPI
jgi:hypothetical protein